MSSSAVSVSRGTPAAAPRAHPRFVLALIVAGGLAAIGLWWDETPAISGLGDWLTNAGRITGLLAGYGVVVLVALMARLPPVERGVGADRLARWHAMGGRYTVCLVATHAVLIIWGYAVTAHTNVISQTKILLISYPDVLAATVGGLLLVGVGISSMRAARRRLRYETWYYLHFYTYLAVALAFSHQFAVGAEFISSLPARIGWGALYIVVFAAIFWYRFVTPVRQAFRHRMRVQSVQPEGPGLVSVVVSGRHLDELRAESGQFFRWRFLARGRWWVSAPYSLSAPPQPDRLRFTAKAIGDHSRALAELRPGTRVVAEGPFGALTAARRRQRQVLLIAGGVGITPLRALFQTLPAGARRPDPGLPGQPGRGRGVPAGIGAAGPAAPRPAVVRRRPSRGPGRRPAQRGRAQRQRPRPGPARRLRVRAARHDRRRYPRTAGRRGPAPEHPPRVVRVLTVPALSLLWPYSGR